MSASDWKDELAPSLFLSGPGGRSWAVFSVDPPGGYSIESDIPIAINGKSPMYRYMLGRVLGQGKVRVGFVMLNPSTADAHQDDPTIRKCLGFARRWEASEIFVANCYAFRATDPKALQHAADPVGPLNERALRSMAKKMDYIVCGWGRHARERGVQTAKLLANAGADLRCLAINHDGSPKHPLYVPYPKDGEDAGPPKYNPYAEVVIGR